MNTQPTSIRSRIARVTTLVAATAICASALTISASTPALADGLTVNAIRLDSDHVVVRDPMTTANSFTTDAVAHLDRGTIRVGMYGTLVRSTSSPGCKAARAVFTYADGSTSKATSARVCKEFNTYLLRPSLFSDSSRQVVRYAVQLLTSADSTAPLTVIAGNTEYVGDAPDSTGTATRLDHDINVATIQGGFGRKYIGFLWRRRNRGRRSWPCCCMQRGKRDD